jgi:hypothetical protein
MNEQGGFIVSIKTLEKVDFERLSSRYNFDLFQHSATFDEEKKQFIVDALVNLEQIGQLVRDGYVVEVKAYHLAQGLPASEIVDITEWLKEDEEREKAEKAREKAREKAKGKAKAKTPRRAPMQPYEGGTTLPARLYLDSDAVLRVLNILPNRHPNLCKVVGLPQTHQGRTVPYLHIQVNPGKPGVLFVGGLHARELINTDILVALAFDLLTVYHYRYDLTYGNKLFHANIIKRIMENLEIFILPLANPDGRVHAMNTYNLWRMNRNPNGGRTCPGSTCPQVDGKGVDCNRNFDFLWNSGIMTSSDPCDCRQIYKGSSPFSEPETRNIRMLLDQNPNISNMVDLHSYAEKVLYPWQIDENQVTDSAMNFRNPSYDGQRGHLGDRYKEYIPQRHSDRYPFIATKVRDAINSVRSGQYTSGQGAVIIYPASATATDYAYSRHFVDPGKTKVFSLGIETAKAFNPVFPENGAPTSPQEKWKITKEISAGLIEFLRWSPVHF